MHEWEIVSSGNRELKGMKLLAGPGLSGPPLNERAVKNGGESYYI